MFESFSHWLSSSAEEAVLFEHPEQEAIHTALAHILYQIITADDQESTKEKHEFAQIIQHEFKLDDGQVAGLHERVCQMKANIEEDLEMIKQYIKDKPGVKLEFMRMLNHLVSLDGVKEKELDIFYQAQKALFPELGDKAF